jgi:hypothetical protein
MLRKLFRRTRDVMRQNLKPQEHISIEEWEEITDRYADAKRFKSGKVYSLLKEELAHAEELVMLNRIHEVREVKVISEAFQKIFTTPKREQVDEVVGQVKFIRGLLKEIDSWIERKESLEKLEGDNKITIARNDK